MSSKTKLSKMAPLKYKSLELQEYLKCKNLTEREKKLLHIYVQNTDGQTAK